MKICILSTGRAGSTSLYGVLNKHLPPNYYCALEPFNTNMNRPDGFNVNQKSIIESKDNVLIKTLIGHTQKGIDIDDMYVWLFEHFDEIILLDRLDKQLQVESFSYQTYKNDLRWHDKKRYRMELVPKDIIETNVKRLEYSTNKINELAKKYNKKIYYYEDVFLDNNIETINEFFNIIKQTPNQDLLDFWVISDEKRVRLNDDEIKLL
jgi:hypothetical protein